MPRKYCKFLQISIKISLLKLLQVLKPGFNFMTHREKQVIKFGQRVYQETMYCHEDYKCSEVNVGHFLLNTSTSNSDCCAKG